MGINYIKEFYKNKKVFITGHTGFKGSWLCAVLLSFGAKIKGFSLEPNTIPALYNILDLDNKLESVIGDIRNQKQISQAISDFKPDIVFHLAAQPLVLESYKNPVWTYETNVIGTVNFLEACRNIDSIKSIVNITTDKVYENRELEKGYIETDNLCGYDPYSNSKSCSELVTYSYKMSFFNETNSPAISTARSGNVVGGGDFSENRIIPDCITASLKKEDIIVRNPHSTRPYQHVLECLRGYLLLAMKQYENKKISGAFNFGPNDEDNVTTGNLVDIFCEKWGNVKWINKCLETPHEANFLKLNNSKAKEVLDWVPKIGIEKAIELTCEWTKEWNSNNKGIYEFTIEQINDYF